MRDLEEVMLEEQRLAADAAAKANEVAAASATQEAAAQATAAAFPAASSSDVSEIVEVLEGVLSHLRDSLHSVALNEPGSCYYKGCQKPGHCWDHCPKLAMHVAKNPTDLFIAASEEEGMEY